VARKGDGYMGAYFATPTEGYKYSTISLPFPSVILPSTAVEINFYFLVPSKTYCSLVLSMSFLNSKLVATLGVKPVKQSAIHDYRRETCIQANSKVFHPSLISLG
jgi:hypothetical protein